MFSLTCPLCDTPGGTVLVERADYRIVRVADPDYPGFCRVIWRDHVAEMTDLTPAQRLAVMQAVFAVEHALRLLYQPHKINLASLGNVVPHLHWHVIARRDDDRHFPQPVWAAPQREGRVAWPEVPDAHLAQAIEDALDEAS